MLQRHGRRAGQGQGIAIIGRRRCLCIKADAHKARAFMHPKGFGLVDRGIFPLALQIGDVDQLAALTVEGPAVIAALDCAAAQDATKRKRRAAMRATIFQRAHSAIGVAPEYDRLIANIDVEGLFRADFFRAGHGPPNCFAHNRLASPKVHLVTIKLTHDNLIVNVCPWQRWLKLLRVLRNRAQIRQPGENVAGAGHVRMQRNRWMRPRCCAPPSPPLPLTGMRLRRCARWRVTWA